MFSDSLNVKWLQILIIIFTLSLLQLRVLAQSDQMEIPFERDIHDYRIAYLFADDVTSSSEILSPQSIISSTGAIQFTDWQDFIEQDIDEAFNIVLLHESMYSEVEHEWFHKAYRNNVIIIGLNIPHESMTLLTDDQCLESPDYVLIDGENRSFIVSYTLAIRTAQGFSDEQLEQIANAVTQTCDYNYETVNTTLYWQVTHGRIQTYLSDTEEDLEWLVDFIVAETITHDYVHIP